VQMTVANAYPGAVYDGLVLTCSFPDVITGGAQFGDYHLMLDYFNNTAGWGPGVAWLPTQMAAVEGQGLPISAIVADVALFKVAISPIGTCVAPAAAYNPQTNPGGVRCDVLDYMLNVLGPRPREVWTPPEVAAGRGFAGFPFGNIGIQYGLEALRSGQITADQFVDLNAKVGGIDINGQHSAERLRGDDASIANAYRSGLVNEADNLSDVAILNYAGPDPGLAHDTAHAWWIRERLDAAQGNHDNNVIWYGNFPLIGDPAWPTSALLAMDRWLSAVHADGSDRPLAQKIAKDRPADIHDRCELLPGLSDYPATDVCLPPALQTRFSTPRGVAGGGPLNDVLKCRLRPASRSDYGTPGLSDAQWARVKQIFPTGVCDWSKPGVGQQRNIPWMTYQDSRGRVIYGGRRMAG